jgi:hypothetical protein
VQTYQEPPEKVLNWWELGQRYVAVATQAQKNGAEASEAAKKNEATQAVIEAIKTGNRTFNPFIQLLINDGLEYEAEREQLMTKDLEYFNTTVYPVRAAWAGVQASFPLLSGIKEELKLFLQKKNLLAGNFLLKGRPPVRIFFKQVAADVNGVNFFELIQAQGAHEEQISTMEKLVQQDESARRYLIEAIKMSAERDKFIPKDAKVKKFKQEEKQLRMSIDVLIASIHDLLKDSSLQGLEPGQLCQLVRQRPNKPKQVEKLNNELSTQNASLLSIHRGICKYYESKITAFFDNLKKDPTLFDAHCALIHARTFHYSLRVWQYSEATKDLESLGDYLQPAKSNEIKDFQMLSSGSFRQLTKAALEVNQLVDDDIPRLNKKLEELIEEAQISSWESFKEGYLKAYCPSLSNLDEYKQIYDEQFAVTWQLGKFDESEFFVAVEGTNINEILALIDEKIKLLDSTMPLIEAHYQALQPLTNEVDEFQKVIQQKREKSIRSIIERNGEERIPASILKKWTSEWRQTADTRPPLSPFSDFLKQKLLAWAGIVGVNSQDPQSQSSLALLSLQYDNNLEIYHFLVSKRNSKVDLRNNRDLVVADYSLDSGRLVSSGLQNEIRARMHTALNLLYKMDTDVRQYSDKYHLRGLRHQAKIESNEALCSLYSGIWGILEKIGFDRHFKERDKEVERLLEIIQNAINRLPDSFRNQVQHELSRSYHGVNSKLRTLVKSYLKEIDKNPDLVNGCTDINEQYNAQIEQLKALYTREIEALRQENVELRSLLKKQEQKFEQQRQQLKQQFEQRLKEEKDKLLALMRNIAVAPNQSVEIIDQYMQTQHDSQVAEPLESVAASSSAGSPQDKQKGKQRQLHSSSPNMWSKPKGLTGEKPAKKNNDEDDESEDRLNNIR